MNPAAVELGKTPTGDPVVSWTEQLKDPAGNRFDRSFLAGGSLTFYVDGWSAAMVSMVTNALLGVAR